MEMTQHGRLWSNGCGDGSFGNAISEKGWGDSSLGTPHRPQHHHVFLKLRQQLNYLEVPLEKGSGGNVFV